MRFIFLILFSFTMLSCALAEHGRMLNEKSDAALIAEADRLLDLRNNTLDTVRVVRTTITVNGSTTSVSVRVPR